MNIYAGRAFGWGWPEHHDHGFLGGDDMKTRVGERILAPVAGKATRTLHSFTITEPDGWKTQALELGSTVSVSSVKVGDSIGLAGAKWVHWHSIRPDGLRVPARFLQEAPPAATTRKRNMTTNFVDSSTFDGSGNAVATTVYATGGEFGFPWQEFTRGTLPLASSRYQYALDVHGRFIPLNHTDFLAYKAAYTSGSGASSSGLTTAEHNQLFDIPNKAETAALHTTQTGDINNHTTAAVNGITLTATP